MLIGRLVRLRAVEPSDYGTLAAWLNNPDVMYFWGKPGHTRSVAEVAADEERMAARGNSRKYMIEALDGTPIGQIDYYELDWQSRSASTSIMVGDKNYWGGGFGTDAMRTLLRFLFEELGLHRVALTVHASNERARRSYEKAGFVVEGTLREWTYFEGEWKDALLMAVLDRDFRDRESNG